ncbi:MAG: thioesterase [Chloroflexi bacterium]|nr:thioesterase [Chloroflexota bacterium]
MVAAVDGFQPGMSGELSVVVTPEMTAAHFGNQGVEVLATPYVVGLLETASVLAVGAALRPGQATVGTRVDIRHEAATPCGVQVTASARLIEVDGRRLTFAVEARDPLDRVAFGTHERVVIDLVRFLERTKKKLSGSRPQPP